MRLLTVGAVLVCLVIGWFGFAVADWSGLLWSACLVLAFVTLAGRAGAGDVRPSGVGERDDHFDQAGRYPQYEQLATQLRWALRDGRYFTNVLAFDLRRLAHDVAAHRRGRSMSDEELAAALGPDVWRVLTPEPLSRERDDMPSEAEMAMILSAVEGL